jgi:primary-amine oxidase
MTTYVIGNYTYSTRYIFRLDGGIDVRVSATGTTLNQGIRTLREGERHGTPLLPDVAAPIHQHFFNFRIDFDVDGTRNRVVEQNVVPATSPATNGFLVHTAPLPTEGARDADPATSRQWVVQSTTRRNIVGHRTGYAITDLQSTTAYSGASFPPLQHAPFAQHAVWVTRYRPGQMYAAGDYPNQGKIGEGLASYAAGKASVRGKDDVVWVTTSFTHLPDIEEYPVMTSEEVGFSLRPDGFFDRNPALDVP